MTLNNKITIYGGYFDYVIMVDTRNISFPKVFLMSPPFSKMSEKLDLLG